MLFMKTYAKFTQSFRKIHEYSKTRITLGDVAGHAGVSQATVSRVLNKSANVRRDLEERVINSISDLGYEVAVARV